MCAVAAGISAVIIGWQLRMMDATASVCTNTGNFMCIQELPFETHSAVLSIPSS